MVETEIQKLKRLRLPKITGSWSEISSKLLILSKSTFMNFDGCLIKFIGVKDNNENYYTTYYYTKNNINKLFLRKRNNCFMIPGDCGQHNYPEDVFIFELVEIPFDCHGLDVVKFRDSYNVKLAEKEQYKYY